MSIKWPNWPPKGVRRTGHVKQIKSNQLYKIIVVKIKQNKQRTKSKKKQQLLHFCPVANNFS